MEKPPVILEEEYDTIEFDVNDEVNIEHDIDKILDFLNGFPTELKENVLTSLNKNDGKFDKALFFVSESLDIPAKTYYMILCKIVTLDEKGLMLMYSTNIDLLSLYMSGITTLSYDKVKEGFKTKPKDDK